jgi:DNA-binding SARP family transcriptional activator
MEFRILGPLELIDADGAVTADPPRQQRRAICALVLHAGQRLEPDVLAELIWSKPPSDGALRTCLYQVRRLIGDERLVYRNGGYRFVLQPEDRTDIGTFRTQVDGARRALDDGNLETAATLFTEALSQWRDPVLRDLPDTETAHAAASGVIDERRRARDALATALFDLGRTDELIELLSRKVTDEPLNEDAWAQLMLALYRGGRATEALHTYDHARMVLQIEAGAEPGAPLRQLRDQIHDDDPALLDPASGAAARNRTPRLRQLPPDVPNFTGRATEIAQLRALLTADRDTDSTPPIAVLTGLPGAGKTSLAVRMARMLADIYPDGQVFVQLAGSSTEPRDPGAVLAEVLRALGSGPLLPETLSERAALFRSQLADRRMLIVADDAASYAQVLPLLPGSPECAVIITSRYRSVSPAGLLHIQLNRLDDANALALLAEIIGRPRVEAERDAAMRLVASCAGSPLAVRIAGARLAAMRTWPVSHMAGLLTDPTRLLDQLQLGDLAVRQVIGTGYALLGPREQAACRRLTLIGPHDFAGWLVAVLLGEANADDVIERLVDASLLQPVGVDATGQPRYRLHDLVRAYAAERLADDPDRDAVLERLLAALMELTDLADAQLPRDPHCLQFMHIHQRSNVSEELAERLLSLDARAWLEAERLVVLAAVFAACQTGRIRLATGIALRMDAFMQAHGYHEDAVNMWRTLVSAGELGLVEQTKQLNAITNPEMPLRPPADAILVERVRYRLAALLAANRDRPDQALPMLNRSITTFEQASLEDDLARALYMRGYCLHLVGQLADARRDADHALTIARRCTDRRTEALALSVLGLIRSREGRHEQARDYCGPAVVISREIDEPSLEALMLFRLIHVVGVAGHHARAFQLCEEGFALTDRISHDLSRGYLHLKAGQALRGLGRHVEAVPHLQRALSTFLSHGAAPLSTIRCRRDLADSYLRLGNHAAARPHFEQCITGFRSLGLAEEAESAAAALRAATAKLEVTRPNVARIYDYLLGGKENFEADRIATKQIEKTSPEIREAARTNRAFLGRVVRFLLAEAGIRQIIDIGTGLPTQGNVHDIANTIAPDTRIVYVDNDPEVVAHAGALLAGRRTTRVIEGDIRHPDDILADPRLRELIDFRRPAAMLIVGVLHFVSDEDDPTNLVARLTAPLAAGSYLAISHGTGDSLGAGVADAARKIYSRSNAGLFLRSAGEVAKMFAGFEILDPGIGLVKKWRPDDAEHSSSGPDDVIGGVAYKRAPGGILRTNR